MCAFGLPKPRSRQSVLSLLVGEQLFVQLESNISSTFATLQKSLEEDLPANAEPDLDICHETLQFFAPFARDAKLAFEQAEPA